MSTKKSYMVLIIGSVASVLIASIGFFVDRLTAYSSALLAVLVFILFEVISRCLDSLDIHEKLDAILKKQKEVKVTRVGHSGAAELIVKQNIEDAVSVKNTFLIPERLINPIEHHTEAVENDIVYYTKEFVKNKNNRENTWVDIYSPSGTRRLENIGRHFQEENINYRDVYFAYKTHHHFPIVDFIIFDYGKSDGKDNKEIWFGWGYYHRLKSEVFRSEDEEIIKYFENYFSALLEQSVSAPVDMKQYTNIPNQ